MPVVLSVLDLAAPEAPNATALRPPPRFKTVTFASYEPQDPSQQRASARVGEFVAARPWAPARQTLHRWPWSRARGAAVARGGVDGVRGLARPGLYLDGGFGVGKTHLLAAAFAEADTANKRYLTFQDLVYLIGVLGRGAAERELAGCDLLCIDEFELDDPGNTLIVKSFLAAHFAGGGTVITTSNTAPQAQGRGRFNAEDFRREIQSVAERFELLPIGGPDYRHRSAVGDWLSEAGVDALLSSQLAPRRVLRLTFAELQALLTSLHPSRYAGLLGQVDAVVVDGVKVIERQAEALRFVHFVDKLYDHGLRLAATAYFPLAELFHADYRHSGYHKKHERCLSRLSELLAHEGSGEAGADHHYDRRPDRADSEARAGASSAP